MGSRDLPFESDEPGQVERVGRYEDRAPPKTIELPGPDERHRAYQELRARVDAEAAEQAGQAPECGRQPKEADQRSGGIDQRSYWDQVPRLLEMWADHQRRWPADRQQPIRDLSSEPHAKTVEAIDRMREAEQAISADVQTIEKENTYDGWLAGFEHRLKGEDRLKEKIAEGLATASPDATPDQVLRLMIPDAVRYTFCFEPASYTRGCYDIKERLESRSYQMYYSQNYWTNPEYKGINTRWVTADGQRFEVQFHTRESFHAKHDVTHEAYERIRNTMATSRPELRELHAFQRAVSARLQVPDGTANIPNYRKEGF